MTSAVSPPEREVAGQTGFGCHVTRVARRPRRRHHRQRPPAPDAGRVLQVPAGR